MARLIARKVGYANGEKKMNTTPIPITQRDLERLEHHLYFDTVRALSGCGMLREELVRGGRQLRLRVDTIVDQPEAQQLFWRSGGVSQISNSKVQTNV